MTNIRIQEIKRQIGEQRKIFESDQHYLHRAAEMQLERLEDQLEAAQHSERAYQQREQERQEAAREREREARRELDRELMQQCMDSAPGVTRAEARKALPKLRERYRMENLDKLDRQVEDARRSGRYSI